MHPHLAPAFDVPPVPLAEKLSATAINILPLVFVVFSVVGVIFMGLATLYWCGRHSLVKALAPQPDAQKAMGPAE